MPRKKKGVAPVEPQPFSVGAPEESDDSTAAASLGEGTVDGILDLRGHLEQRAPSLLWPLQKLPSMSQHLSDIESAGEAVDKLSVRHALSNGKLAELRNFLLNDAYAFTYLVCRLHDIRPEVHMALCYAAAGQAGNLAWLLTQSGFDGYLFDQFRNECQLRSIDLTSPGGVHLLDSALDWVNMRLPRGAYKSSTVTVGGAALTATADPNTTAQITHAKEDKAYENCDQIGQIVTSGIYRDLFPDRVPLAARDVSTGWIKLNGRTISHPQTTLQAQGYLSKDIGGHFCKFWVGDLVVRGPKGNASASMLPGVEKWLSGMQGYFMLSMRVRRVHEGTVATDGDDFTWLTRKGRRKQCFSIRIPIETYPDGVPRDLTKRGTPTMPTFLPEDRINEIQRNVFADESEQQGVENWLCDYLLIPAADGGKLFDEELVNDQDRTWLGPFMHPKARLRGGEKYAARFLVAKVNRDSEGRPLDKNEKPIDVRANENWRALAQTSSFDPWEDMDVLITLDPTWKQGAKHWALTVSAVDPDLVKFQIETRAGDGGMSEWTPVLVAMNERYRPRVIGIDRFALQDPIVQNALRVDVGLRRLARKVAPVDHSETIQEARVRAAVLEQMKRYRLLLLPTGPDAKRDFGAFITRKEMLGYRPNMDAPFPILDSLAMIDSLARRVPTREQRANAKQKRIDAEARYRQSINPALGVPFAS